MIYIGDNELLGVKLGNDDITGIYVGDNLIYPTTVTAWTVEPSSFSIPFDDEIARIKLAALTPWTATTDANWITLSESTGDGGRYRIDMTVSPNISTARTANVVITGEDTHTETISVSQAAIPFSASVDSISTYSEGGSFSFDIMCPHSWSLVVSGDSTNWLTVSPLIGSNGTVQVGVVISQLEGDEDRNADLVITDDVTGDELIISVNQSPIPPYEKQYLTFEILSAGTITWKGTKNDNLKTISYRKDNSLNWTDITSTTAGTSFNVDAGDKILFKGENTNYAISDNNYNGFLGSTAVYNVYGNIMSLVGGDNFSGLTTLNSAFTFHSLFRTTKVNDATNLVLPATVLSIWCYKSMFESSRLVFPPKLPATTLVEKCYYGMFYGCTGLTSAPELPATTLAVGCYQQMFQNCTSLTTAPVLSATTLANSCYVGMFRDCESLATAPELPATTLVNGCYQQMFYGCHHLNYIKCLATNISASNSRSNWVQSTSYSGTFVKSAGISEATWGRGTSGIPNNWTVEDAS